MTTSDYISSDVEAQLEDTKPHKTNECTTIYMALCACINTMLIPAIILTILWPWTIAHLDYTFNTNLTVLIVCGSLFQITKYGTCIVIFWNSIFDMYFGISGTICIIFACGLEIITHLFGYTMFTLTHYNVPYCTIINNLIGIIIVMTMILMICMPYTIIRTMSRSTFDNPDPLILMYSVYWFMTMCYIIMWPLTMDNWLWFILVVFECILIVFIPSCIMCEFEYLDIDPLDIIFAPYKLFFEPIYVGILICNCIMVCVSHIIGYKILQKSQSDTPMFFVLNQVIGILILTGGISILYFVATRIKSLLI